MTSPLDDLDEQYERAEAAFLQAVRTGAGSAHLAQISGAVAAAAQRWNIEAYRLFHAAGDPVADSLDWLTERTEVLTELWADLAAAYAAAATSPHRSPAILPPPGTPDSRRPRPSRWQVRQRVLTAEQNRTAVRVQAVIATPRLVLRMVSDSPGFVEGGR